MLVTSELLPSAAPVRRPVSLWLWALFCAAVAVGPIWFTWLVKRLGFVSPDASPLGEYDGLGAWFYYGGAAACAVLLVRQSRHAVSASLVVVGWAAFTLLGFSWQWLHGNLDSSWVLARAAKLVIFALLLRFAVRQQRAGVLR